MGSSESKQQPTCEEFSQLFQQIEKCYNECDLQCLVDMMYDDESIVMPPTGTICIGKTEIMEMIQKFFNHGKASTKMEYCICTEKGAYTRYTFKFTNEQGKEETGCGVALWKKVGEKQYKAYNNIFTMTGRSGQTS